MQKIKAIIVEDEITAVDALKEELGIYCPQLDIVAVSDGFVSAVAAIDEYGPSIVFMDIHLGDGTGFDVLQHTHWKNYATIFTTAYDQYAIKAFKTNAVDYLLKPINGIELLAAVNKALHVHAVQEQQGVGGPYKTNNKIAIQLSKEIVLMPINDIIRVEAEGNYARIYSTSGQRLLSSKTLKSFEDTLMPHGFVRVHHAYLINMEHIKKVHTKEGLAIEMSDLASIPVSQRKKAQVLSMIESIKV